VARASCSREWETRTGPAREQDAPATFECDAEEAVQLSEEIKGPKFLVLVWRQGRTRYIPIDEARE
jgi:hypothetical protein